MQQLVLAVQRTNRLFLPLLKRNTLELAGLFLLCDLLDQYFKFIGQFVRDQGGLSMPALFGRFTVSLLLMVLLTHWVPLRVLQMEGQLPAENLINFVMRHIKAFTLESLRALGIVLLFSLLLLLPGVWKYVQYIFVPYVVLADPDYEAGQVDALEESKRLMKGFNVLGMLLLLGSIPAILYLGQLTEPLLITYAPVKWAIAFLGLSAVTYYLNLLLFEFYRVRKTLEKQVRRDHGPNV